MDTTIHITTNYNLKIHKKSIKLSNWLSSNDLFKNHLIYNIGTSYGIDIPFTLSLKMMNFVKTMTVKCTYTTEVEEIGRSSRQYEVIKQYNQWIENLIQPILENKRIDKKNCMMIYSKCKNQLPQEMLDHIRSFVFDYTFSFPISQNLTTRVHNLRWSLLSMLSKHDIDAYIQQSKCGSDLHIFVTKDTNREIVEKQYSCIANSRSLQIVEVDFYDNSESVRLKSETDIIQDCIRV